MEGVCQHVDAVWKLLRVGEEAVGVGVAVGFDGPAVVDCGC